MSKEPKQPRMRRCFYCGEELGCYAEYDPLDTCGKQECERAARDAIEEERAEADYEIACMQAIRGMLKLLIGANVPEDLPQPSDLFAALIHVHQIAAEMPAGKEVEAIEAIRKVAGYALAGVPIAAPKPKEEKAC